MVKPLNSRNFGDDAGKIRVYYHNGSTTKSGYIVKQSGTSRYVCTDDETTKICTLAEDTATAESLTAGKCTIKAFTSSAGSGATFTAVYAVDTIEVVDGGSNYVDSEAATVVSGDVDLELELEVDTGAVIGVTITNVDEHAFTAAAISGAALETDKRRFAITGGSGTDATVDITFKLKAITVTDAGSGYVAGQSLTLEDVDGTTAPEVSVATVNATGGITAVSIDNAGAGLHTPASDVTVTGDVTHYVARLWSRLLVTTEGLVLPWSTNSPSATRAQIETITSNA